MVQWLIILILLAVNVYGFYRNSKVKQKLLQDQTKCHKVLENGIQFQEELQKTKEELLQKKSAVKEEAFSEIEEYRQSRLAQIDEECEKTKQLNISRFQSEFIQLQNEEEKFKEQLNQIKRRLQAQYEAQLVEDRKNQEIDSFILQLSESEIEDISQIYKIAENFNNPQILYKLVWSEYIQQHFKQLWSRIGFPTKTAGIYKITNLKNSKVYIGQSVDLQTRLTNHIKAGLKIDTIAHQKIHEAMSREGVWNFSFEILTTCSKAELNNLEKDFIETYHSNEIGYNATGGGS